MKSVIITGGSGYIGRHLVLLFAQSGYNVISLDKKPGIGETRYEIQSYEIDLQHFDEIIDVFKNIEKIDCIIHCAGELGIEKSYAHKNLFYAQNVCVTDNILNAAIQFNVKAFIFASSASVYHESSEPLNTESKICDNPSPYSLSKLICEERIRRVAQYANMNYVLFRFFNVVGCDVTNDNTLNNYLDKPNLIPIVIRAYKKNDAIYINGYQYNTPDRTCMRDYINVCDLARLNLVACSKMISTEWQSHFNGLYNVGTGHSYSILDIINIFHEITGKRIEIVIRDARLGDNSYLCADIINTTKVFNWVPVITIKETISKIIQATMLTSS